MLALRSKQVLQTQVTQGVCCHLLTEEEKTKAWLTDGFYLRCGQFSEVDSWSITSQKNSNEGNLHGGQNFGQCTWLYWEKHWPYVWLYIDSSAIDNGLGGWLRICKEHDWENDEKDTLESGMWIDHLKWTKDVKVCVSYINAHQMLTSTEKYFNDQLVRMTHSMGTIQLLLCPYLSLPVSHEQRGHVGKDGNHAWAQQHGFPPTWVS